jgi:hypothetical protein
MKGSKNSSKNGIIEIDAYEFAKLRDVESQQDVKETFEAFYYLVEEIFKAFDGDCWHRTADRGIFFFPAPTDAVDASLKLIDKLVEFNEKNNRLDSPLFIRIGVHEIEAESIANVPEDEREKLTLPELDIIRKLRQHCPPGKIVISKEVYEDIGSIKRDLFRPASSADLKQRESFVLRRRRIMPQERALLFGLSDEQKFSLPPISFPNWNRIVPDEDTSLTKLNTILEQPLLVVLGETSSQRQGSISSAATSDAIGIIEIMAALKANIDVTAGIDQWEDTADLASNRNIVLIGSGIVNIYAFAFNDIIRPAHFVKAEDRVLDQIVATSRDGRIFFGPHALPPRDCGLVTISKSPFNLEKTLLWIAGITGMGTQAVAKFVFDLIQDPSRPLRKGTAAALIDPIACIVGSRIPKGPWQIFDYYRRWRIADYKILWMVDRNGVPFEPWKQE